MNNVGHVVNKSSAILTLTTPTWGQFVITRQFVITSRTNSCVEFDDSIFSHSREI